MCSHYIGCGKTSYSLWNENLTLNRWSPWFLQHLELVSPYDIYFNPYLVVKQHQVRAFECAILEISTLSSRIRFVHFHDHFWMQQWWRLLTNFFFFGTLSFNFVFNLIFTYRYCRTLEESSFRGRTADFVMMFLFGAVLTLVRLRNKYDEAWDVSKVTRAKYLFFSRLLHTSPTSSSWDMPSPWC